MKIVIFGATGGIGSLVLKKALAVGHEVTAVVRRPNLITTTHPSLKIVKGDVLNPLTLKGKIEKADAVVSTIGVRDTKPTTVYSEGLKNIIAEVKGLGVTRLICISALPVEGVTQGMPLVMKVMTRFLLHPLLRNQYADLLKMEKIVERTGLVWTIVRPTRLTNGKGSAKYRVAIGKHLKNPWKISRSDVADFIIGHLEDESTFGKRVEIAA